MAECESAVETAKALNSLLRFHPDDQEALQDVIDDYFTKPSENNDQCYSDDEDFFDDQGKFTKFYRESMDK